MRHLLLTLCLGLVPAAWAEAPATVLHQLEVVDATGQPFGRGEGRVLALELIPGRAPPAELVRRLPGSARTDGRLLIESLGYAPAKERPRNQHREASFLIDFDEPVFADVRAEVTRQLGPKRPEPEALRSFVEGYIQAKNLTRAYDIASTVARRREGDCTEHAVLLTALLRAYRYPARVVHGLALISNGEAVYAFGHAWTELYQQGRWVPLDAALSGPLSRFYVPLTVITDEGLGFTAGVLSTGGLQDVKRVHVLARPAP